MKRLSLAPPPKNPPSKNGPSLALIKKALRLFKGRGIAKDTYRRNALAWLDAKAALGDRHIFNKATPAKWGQPGEPNVKQVYSPRRCA